jgi:hypothetical protein
METSNCELEKMTRVSDTNFVFVPPLQSFDRPRKILEPSKSASVKTASNEIQKTQFGQRQHTRNQNSQNS